jgi:outer membrane protein W
MPKSILPIIAFLVVVFALRYSCREQKLSDKRTVLYSSDSLAVTEQFLKISYNDTADSSVTHYFTDKTRTKMRAIYTVKKHNGKEIFRQEVQYDSLGKKAAVVK